MKDYYYILGISKSASLNDIKVAYRKLSKKFHPDLNDGDKYFEDRFKEIQEAYEILSNANKRKDYDWRYNNFNKYTNANSTQNDEELKRKEAAQKRKEEKFRREKEAFEREKAKNKNQTTNKYYTNKGKNIKESNGLKKDVINYLKYMLYLALLVFSIFILSFVQNNYRTIVYNFNIFNKETYTNNHLAFEAAIQNFRDKNYLKAFEFAEIYDKNLTLCDYEINQLNLVKNYYYSHYKKWEKIIWIESYLNEFPLKDRKKYYWLGGVPKCCNEIYRKPIIDKNLFYKIKKISEINSRSIKNYLGWDLMKKYGEKLNIKELNKNLRERPSVRKEYVEKLKAFNPSFNLDSLEAELPLVFNIEKKDILSLIRNIPRPIDLKLPVVKLKNGESPFKSCFNTKYDKSSNAWLVVNNQTNSDVIFLLENVLTGQKIRNEFIKSKSTFKMTELPPGTYKMMEIYGTDWSGGITSPCGTAGFFSKNVRYTKSEKADDLLNVVSNYSGYSTGTVYLEPQQYGNLESQSATQYEVFK